MDIQKLHPYYFEEVINIEDPLIMSLLLGSTEVAALRQGIELSKLIEQIFNRSFIH